MSQSEHIPDELPEPSAELVLLRVCVEAHLATVSRRKGERFLRIAAEKLADEEALATVFRIRPAPQHAAARIARKRAGSLFERWLPVFLARLPRN